MANQVKLPRLGQGMEAGTVTKWLKAEGDQVDEGRAALRDRHRQGDAGGRVGLRRRAAEDRAAEGEAPVGQTIAWIGEAGEEIKARRARRPAPERPRRSNAHRSRRPAPAVDRHPRRRSANGGRIKASPLARRLARERGIELASLRGTGPDGRIVAEDVERGAAAPAAAAPLAPAGEVESVPLTNVRKTIARRLTAAWQAPVFQLTVSADMTRANELVAKARELDPDVRVTVTDVLAKVGAPR